MKVLFIVDPQNDFVNPEGSLYVKGAERAIDNICLFIQNNDIDRIIISQDTHQYFHVGHSEFWEGDPQPGTVINNPEDIMSGKYQPKINNIDPVTGKPAVCVLNREGQINIWPHHCIEGSWGCALPERLVVSLNKWAAENKTRYEIYQKGLNPECESFSLFDDTTMSFEGTTKLYICGFCKDFCVYNTLKDIVELKLLPQGDNIEVIDSCTLSYGPDDGALKAKYEDLLILQRGYF